MKYASNNLKNDKKTIMEIPTSIEYAGYHK
jgi:hypothetical protein